MVPEGLSGAVQVLRPDDNKVPARIARFHLGIPGRLRGTRV